TVCRLESRGAAGSKGVGLLHSALGEDTPYDRGEGLPIGSHTGQAARAARMAKGISRGGRIAMQPVASLAVKLPVDEYRRVGRLWGGHFHRFAVRARAADRAQ